MIVKVRGKQIDTEKRRRVYQINGKSDLNEKLAKLARSTESNENKEETVKSEKSETL